MNVGSAAPWRQAGWLDEVTEWTDAQLTGVGLKRLGPMQPRERPWSVVLQFESDVGTLYVKETAAALANDAALTATLAPLAPSLILMPLAVDGPHRRMLLPHGGELLRDALTRRLDASHWERLLPRYAELQLAAAPYAEALILAGAFDRRPPAYPDLLAHLLTDPVARGETGFDGLRSNEVAALEGLIPKLSSAAAELNDLDIGVSVQHDDLHDGNVLISPGGGYRIVDWGDAQVAQPFATLLVTLRSIASRFEVPENGPLIGRLRNAYLEPWATSHDPADLGRAVTLSSWLGTVGRALAWRAGYENGNEEERADLAEGVAEWVRDLLEMEPAGV